MYKIPDLYKMHEIALSEFRANTAAMLDLVEQGETVRILRHGKPVADLVPVQLGLRERGLVEITPLKPDALSENLQIVASGVGAVVLYQGVKLDPRPLRAEFRLGE